MSKVVFKNTLGTIDEEHFLLRDKRQNISFQLKEVNKTSVQRKRNVPIALLGFAGALTLFCVSIWGVFSGFGSVIVLFAPLMVLSFLIGLASWLGHHVLKIELKNGEQKKIIIKMSKIAEGEQLYRELREVVFGEVNQEV